MASSGFCTTCTKIVYYSEPNEAHCPVCSGPLITAVGVDDPVAEEAS